MNKRNYLKFIFASTTTTALLKPEWTTPLINTVVLPSHAQTSFCSMSDIAGEWTIVLGQDQAYGITLNQDGSGQVHTGSDVTWSITGNDIEIIILENNTPTETLMGTINSTTCNDVSGPNWEGIKDSI